ncbi:hypothetical protein [Frankia sp. AiPs1]
MSSRAAAAPSAATACPWCNATRNRTRSLSLRGRL